MTVLQDPSAPSGPAGTPTDHPDHERDGLLARVGRAAGRRPRRVLALWAIVVLLAGPLAVTLTGALSGAGWEAQGSTAQTVRDEIRRDFPQLGAESAVVAYQQTTPIADDPAGLASLVAALQGSEGTTTVVDPIAAGPDAGLVSRDGRTALVPVGLESSSDARRSLTTFFIVGW